MDTWLLVLLIIVGIIVLMILGIAIAYKLMDKEDYDGQTTQEKKRSIYSSKELNRVAQVEYSNPQYGQIGLGNQTTGNRQLTSNVMNDVDKDGFGDGEIVRVDMKQKRIWKENSFQKGVRDESKLVPQGLKNAWSKSQIEIGNQLEIGKVPVDPSKVASVVKPDVKQPQQQVRLGVFSQMKNPNQVKVQQTLNKPKFVPQTEVVVTKPIQPIKQEETPREQQFPSTNSQNQNLLRGGPTLQSKMSEKEYMFQTNKSMNNKVAEWQQKAVRSNQLSYNFLIF